MKEEALRCQSNVTECQDKLCSRDYWHYIKSLLPSSSSASVEVKGLVRSTMKNINYKKAKDFKPGETVRDLGISFIVKEVRVVTGEPGLISFLDTEDVWHGTYHPNEYFAAGEEFVPKYAATYNRQIE